MTATLPDRTHTSVNVGQIAEEMWHDPQLDGFRVEAYNGRVILTPPADGGHADALSAMMEVMFVDYGAILKRQRIKIVQGVGLALPTGPGDYVIPDLSVLDADYRDHRQPKGLYPPRVFRAVVEITSGNWMDDVEAKPGVYAGAGIPAYVIGDRKHGQVHVLSRPDDGAYQTAESFKPGESFTLPGDLPAKIPVDSLLQD